MIAEARTRFVIVETHIKEGRVYCRGLNVFSTFHQFSRLVVVFVVAFDQKRFVGSLLRMQTLLNLHIEVVNWFNVLIKHSTAQ